MPAAPLRCRAALLVVLLFAAAGMAHGHAVVVHTEPADGEVLASAPDRVLVRFNEPVSPIAARLYDGAGQEFPPDGTDMAGGGRELLIALPALAAPATYLASFRVVSVDGHPVGGSIVFSVGEATGPAPVAPGQDRGWRIALMLSRAVLALGILGGAGAVFFLLLVAGSDEARRPTARIAGRFAVAGCCAAFLSVGLQGGLLVGGPARSIADPSTWMTGLASSFGRAAVAALIGLALIALGLRRHGAPTGQALAVAGAALGLASFALSGHVVTAGPRWLTVPLLILHTSAVAFWVGSLLPLVAALSGANPAPVVRRFSRLALVAVPLLVAAGLVIAVLQVGSFSGLTATLYGRLLLAKLALVAALLGLAALNKLRLTPALERADPRAADALRRSIRLEVGLVILILGATAGLGTTPPPRVMAGQSPSAHLHSEHGHTSRGVSLQLENAGRTATISLASAAGGANAARIALRDESGAPVDADEVTFVARNAAAGVESIRRTGERIGVGEWAVPNLLLVPPGRWSIEVAALIGDFERLTFEGTVELE